MERFSSTVRSMSLVSACGNDADGSPDGVGLARNIVAGDDGLSAGDRDERRHHADERAFAGAVGPQQPEDLAFSNLEGDAFDGFKVAVALDDVLERRSPLACGLLTHRAHQLALRDIDLGQHSRHVAHAGVVDQQLQADGLDIPFAAADIALSGKVGFGGFGDDLALNGGSAGHDDAQAVAQLDGVGLGFRQGRVDPGLGQIRNGYDRRSCSYDLALPRRAHVDLAGDRRSTWA